MKIRNGFVSNSSSSSFVILGIIMDDEMSKKYRDPESETPILPAPKGTIAVYYEGVGNVMGIVLGGGDETDFGVRETTVEELKSYADEFEKLVGVKPKLMGGMRMC